MNETNSKTNKKNYIFAFLTVMAIFSMGQIAGSIDAAIATIGEHFGLSEATTMYVSSVSAIASVIFGLVVGIIAGKKVRYKTIALFSGVCVLVGGLVPFVVTNYAILLIFRAIYGIGFGGMMSLQNTFANLTLPKEKQASALGLGMFVGYGTNCILQFIGGPLADISWNYVFLNTLLLIIPFVILLVCCPNIPNNPVARPAESNRAEKEKASYPPVVFIMCVMMALVGLFVAPLLIGCSFLSTAINPSATIAGIVAVCFSVGCMVGGLVYPKLSKAFGRYCFTCFLIIAAIGLVGSALANNIPLLCVTIFLGGMGFSTTQAGAMMVTGASVSKSAVAMASSMIMACFNLGMFLCSPIQAVIDSTMGNGLRTLLYIGTAIFVIGAVVFAIYNPLAGVKKEVELDVEKVAS